MTHSSTDSQSDRLRKAPQTSDLMAIWPPAVERVAEAIEAILDAKQAKDVVRISVTGKTVLADGLIVATALNRTHIKSLTDALVQGLKDKLDRVPDRVEGEASRSWVLLDYGDVIVNLFLADDRAFYNLEKLWSRRHTPEPATPLTETVEP